ncbi:PepSY domain-containing protein [Salibacterium aidingense]|uniref:PepSY domain-containing protein n=1 Tax=Salibacterium aidingense TaxID=384933 RepID=UPI000413375B|nr:PepSY domain-containing protein [Salibacterium aidingense]
MQRWILGAGLALLLLVGLFVILYAAVRTPLADQLEAAEQTVMSEKDMEAVHNTYYYFGNEPVYTVNAERSDGSREWFFLQDESIIDHLPYDESITPEEAEKIVMEQFDRNSIRSVKPGMQDGEPLYEVTFEVDNTLQYYYLSMEDGNFIKRYSLQKS